MVFDAYNPAAPSHEDLVEVDGKFGGFANRYDCQVTHFTTKHTKVLRVFVLIVQDGELNPLYKMVN